MKLIEEYYVAVKYDGDYRTIDFEAVTYDECISFIASYAESTFESFENVECYNSVVEQDRHFCYWKIEKRFRLKQVK